MPVNKAHQKQFAFSWDGQQYAFTVLPQGHIDSPALCHNLVHRDFNHLSLTQYITLDHNIDNIMLIGPRVQDVQTMLILLLRYLCVRK